jgi:hypothetical protein
MRSTGASSEDFELAHAAHRLAAFFYRTASNDWRNAGRRSIPLSWEVHHAHQAWVAENLWRGAFTSEQAEQRLSPTWIYNRLWTRHLVDAPPDGAAATATLTRRGSPALGS